MRLATLTKAGGHSKGNKVPSRAGAAVQPPRRRSRQRVILIEPRELIRDCLANCLAVGDTGFAVLQYSSVHEVDSISGADSIALVLSFLPANQKIPEVGGGGKSDSGSASQRAGRCCCGRR
jgi:hypothetical protein